MVSGRRDNIVLWRKICPSLRLHADIWWVPAILVTLDEIRSFFARHSHLWSRSLERTTFQFGDIPERSIR
jgi:hypothetical protein